MVYLGYVVSSVIDWIRSEELINVFVAVIRPACFTLYYCYMNITSATMDQSLSFESACQMFQGNLHPPERTANGSKLAFSRL